MPCRSRARQARISFATETFEKAEKSLSQAEAYQTRNAGRKPVAMTAREAVQMAEDSRAIAVKRQEEEALAIRQRLQLSGALASAQNGQAAAQSETDRVKRDAETARIKAQADNERLTTRERCAGIGVAGRRRSGQAGE